MYNFKKVAKKFATFFSEFIEMYLNYVKSNV